jgi:hypothetical protein
MSVGFEMGKIIYEYLPCIVAALGKDEWDIGCYE